MANDDEDRLSALLLKWEEAWDLDEDISVADLCANHPELEQALADQIKLLKSMSWMKQDAADDDQDDDEEIDSLIGETLAGRYQIDSIVGFGGHGKVYKAFDPELERHVAVKVSKSIASENQTDELLEEARRAAKLKHSNIVAVYDVGRHEGQLFFVTELVEGQNLADLIAGGRVKPSEATRIVSALADALQFAHQQGFLHRDIKPANILLDHQGRVLVTDFGIATTIDKIEDHRGGTPGTLPYMAPEQIAGQVQLIDGRTDIHALGVVLYELLTGELPYLGRTPTAVREQILLRQPKPLSSLNRLVPKKLEAICLKCLAKHPADRYRTAMEVKQAFETPDSTSIAKIGLVVLGISLIALSLIAWRPWNGENTSAESKVAAPLVEGGIMFDGIRRILTPVMNSTLPLTIEAWIAPSDVNNSENQFIVGSDVPGHFGIGMGIGKGGHPMAETVRGGIDATRFRLSTNRWSHLAAVFASDETRIYLDGKLAATCEATNVPEVESPFVIGNLGEQQGNMRFTGKLRSVRISSGEKFKGEFISDESFTTSDHSEALLIYDESSFGGDQIKDLSGSGNDGSWESIVN
ncbi:protein kinase domain-containing protein [Rhodopirellula bahusiensis]|uniref:Serine/threonine protein kinase n=1 Tax=Rhodopirellula bahusiensis TaxID=2014065 RepID=A0A2G1W708_9BACT|nr:protein kinase [Rhodopirellula bahusiensis]PHQ34825.1 serine/threonine protein kinase [Rhodopirellula bahusiensis]